MLVTLHKIGEVYFHSLGTNSFHVKAKNERFSLLLRARVVVRSWNIISAIQRGTIELCEKSNGTFGLTGVFRRSHANECGGRKRRTANNEGHEISQRLCQVWCSVGLPSLSTLLTLPLPSFRSLSPVPSSSPPPPFFSPLLSPLPSPRALATRQSPLGHSGHS